MKKENPAVFYGLIGALILAVFGLLLQFYTLSILEKAASEDASFSPMKFVGVFLISMVVTIGVFIFCIVKAIKAYRKKNPEFTYKKLVGQGLIVTLVIALTTTAFSYLYNYVINAEGTKKQVALMEQVYEKMDIPEEDKEKMMEGVRNQSPIRAVISGLAITLIGGLIITLISASVLNKKPGDMFNSNQLR